MNITDNAINQTFNIELTQHEMRYLHYVVGGTLVAIDLADGITNNPIFDAIDQALVRNS